MTKRKSPRPSWKPVARASVLIIIFSVASIAFEKLLSLLPDSGKLSPLVTLGLPLALAWLIAATLGRNIVPAKHALALATICLLVAAPLAYYKPWERAGGWQPGGGELPENFAIPEGYVAFRFVSAFTYVSSEGNQPITNVELELPWPYVDAYENGRPCPKPVGLDNWLIKTSVAGSVYDNSIAQYLKEVWKAEPEVSQVPWQGDNITEYSFYIENAAWAVNLSLAGGLPYENVAFKPELKLYYGDQLEWQDNRLIGLLGNRTVPPTITAHIEYQSRIDVFQKVTVKLSDLRPGETVSIEGIFLVAEENVLKVRLDDWISSGMDRVYYKPDQENAPHISVGWSPDKTITSRALAQLEKLVGNNYALVIRYDEEWNLPSGAGLIDGSITRG